MPGFCSSIIEKNGRVNVIPLYEGYERPERYYGIVHDATR